MSGALPACTQQLPAHTIPAPAHSSRQADHCPAVQAEELEESLSGRLQQLPPPLARGSTGRVSESSDGASLQGDSHPGLTALTQRPG